MGRRIDLRPRSGERGYDTLSANPLGMKYPGYRFPFFDFGNERVRVRVSRETGLEWMCSRGGLRVSRETGGLEWMHVSRETCVLFHKPRGTLSHSIL